MNDGERKAFEFVEEVRRRLEQCQGTFIAIIGGTKSSRSYSALRLAEMIDSNFNATENIVFQATEFIRAVQRARKGAAIVFDEGIQIPARGGWSLQNRLLDYAIQASTFKSLCVILTLPISSVDDAIIRTSEKNVVLTLPLVSSIDKDNDAINAIISSIISFIEGEKNATTTFVDKRIPLLLDYILKIQSVKTDAIVLQPHKVTRRSGEEDAYLIYPRFRISKPSKRVLSDYEAKKKRYLSEMCELLKNHKRSWGGAIKSDGGKAGCG